MTRTVLVTGGAGYIGSHACKALSLAGYLPVAVDNLCSGHRDFARWGPLVEADIRDGAALDAAFAEHAPVAVMHFAAHTHVGESVTDPQRYYDNNVAGSLSLLSAARRAGVDRVVFSSTCAIYGEFEGGLLTEATPQDPITPYGRSKQMVERILADFDAAYGMRAIALRYFNACGADPGGEIGEDHDPETHLIPRVIYRAMGREIDLTVFGTDYPTRDGTALRDYIHVGDLAEAHVLALRRLIETGRSDRINLGTGRGCSVLEIIEAARAVSGQAFTHGTGPRRAGDPAELVADVARAREVLGFAATRSSVRNILSTALDWHRRRHG